MTLPEGAVHGILPGLQHLAVPVADLVPDAANARLHDERNLQTIASPLKRFGQRQPLVVQESGMLVRAGNGRLEAAKRLGWTHVAALVLDDAQVEAVAYAIADNRSGELATWDESALARTLKAIEDEGGRASELGWDAAELNRILRAVNGVGVSSAADVVPDPAQVEARTKPGDLWALGKHRLLCGDATDAAAVARLLDGARTNVMVTDPPYGVEYDPGWRQRAAAAGHLAYADRRVGQVANDDRADWRAAWALHSGAVAYCWSPPGANLITHGQALQAAGFELRTLIVWSKPHFPISRGHYHHRHEPCWYAVRAGATAAWVGDRVQTTVWDVTLDANVPGGHSAQKPVELYRRPLRNHAGDLYDPFSGTGTGLMAAELEGRAGYALELEPRWCDVALARWEGLTGDKVAHLTAAS